MTLKLDPSIPVVWRNPCDLQFGVDQPQLVIRNLSGADEQVIAALTAGVTAEGAAMLAERAGGSRAEVAALLVRLRPVLQAETSAPRQSTIAVAGAGEAADAVRCGLSTAGHVLVRGDAAAQVGIAVSSYATHPQVFGRWLRDDVPHFSVTFGDRLATLGPVVVPGAGPCLNCVFYHRTAEDDAWPALATQLLDQISPLRAPESAATIFRAAAQAVQWADLIAGGRALQLAGLRWQLCDRSGEVTVSVVPVHPACGCAALPEIDSADAHSPGHNPNVSTRSTTAAAHG